MPLIRPWALNFSLYVLERECVERSAELLAREDEGNGEPVAFPRMRHMRARFEVTEAERVNEREAGERGVSVAIDPRAVRHDRSETAGEDALQIHHERRRRLRR